MIRPERKHIIAVAILVLFTAFVLWGPPDMLARTSTPDYCNTCHVMNDHYDSWHKTALHRNAKCVDCHLPHTNYPRYLFWKGIDGMKDMFMFHSGLYPEQIDISSHGKKVLKENCIRCHEGLLTMINTDDRNCWDCHRRVRHRVIPVITLK